MGDAILAGADPRVTRHTAQLNGHTYQYVLGLPPSGTYKATIFLVPLPPSLRENKTSNLTPALKLHGWPDLAIGWRHQIPALLDLNLRVVAPDLLGYGGTDAPRCPPAPLAVYSYKASASAIIALATHLSAPQIILGGHDWGGALAYRIALWHADRISHIFVIGTPYFPPSPTYTPLPMLAQRFPNFAYQLQLQGPEVEERTRSRAEIRRLLNALWGGRGAAGERGFDPRVGVLWDALERLGECQLVSAAVLDYYAEQYARNGMHGPLNWYRIFETNYTEERDLPTTSPILALPVLFVAMTRDEILAPELAAHMESVVPNLTRREVHSGHWALVEKAREVNALLGEWVGGVVFGGVAKL
ncbi:MAG: hypothetical protein M1829_001918 [Trizodia sp. TS-e1964]|nr:MAG: hypothetical protein M1829_001918 [Trizodia sp. TS-e1964]